MKLSGTEELVRDIFLIGCFTGQRVSDYGRIEPEWVGTTRNGVRVIRLQQKKTGHNVIAQFVMKWIRMVATWLKSQKLLL